MSKILSVHQPQYLPWIGYFDKIARSDLFVVLDTVQYKHAEFQNRNKIRSPEGWRWLSVPVQVKGRSRQNIRDVLIDNSLSWKHDHWESIRSCYGRSPYFEKYSLFFEKAYSVEWEKLADLNIHIIKYMLSELSISTPMKLESELATEFVSTDRIVELCRKLNADTYLSGVGGREYLEEEKFSKAGIKLVYQDFAHPAYKQQFMKDDPDFLPYMSAIDLLFNEGPRAREMLLDRKK